jgi:uncharacterized protein HemX
MAPRDTLRPGERAPVSSDPVSLRLPRELPGWVYKLGATLLTAVVVPLALAGKGWIDAQTALVTAEAELKAEQIETEKKRQEAYKAETEGVRSLEVRVGALESLRSEVNQLRVNLEGTAEQVTELTPATRPPKKLRVRLSP